MPTWKKEIPRAEKSEVEEREGEKEADDLIDDDDSDGVEVVEERRSTISTNGSRKSNSSISSNRFLLDLLFQ